MSPMPAVAMTSTNSIIFIQGWALKSETQDKVIQHAKKITLDRCSEGWSYSTLCSSIQHDNLLLQ